MKFQSQATLDTRCFCWHEMQHLFFQQIATLAKGEAWSPSSSTAKSFPSPTSYSDDKQDYGSSYQSGGGGGDQNSYQNINSPGFKSQTENFFARKQNENSSRPE